MVVFALTSLFLIASPAAASQVKVEACRLPVTELLPGGRTSFSVIATFSVDDEGTPHEVKVLLGDRYVEPGAVEACVRSWKVPVVTIEGVAVWRWVDGCGWERLKVRVGAMTLLLRGSDRPCPPPRAPRPEGVRLARSDGRSPAAGTIGVADDHEEARRCPRSRSTPESRTHERSSRRSRATGRPSSST